MRRLHVDKIASVTANCRLSKELSIDDEFLCREGDVVAVRVLSRKSTYDRLELTTGRFCQLKPGDVVAGALGHRRALLGYAGHVPKELAPGDRINLLNVGGVLGICTSQNPDLGPPFECEVLGQVLHFPYLGERIGEPASITRSARPKPKSFDLGGVPVIAVVGTCMNSGKTYACSALIQELVRRGLVVHAAKATGVSLRRDVLAMEDAGARETLVFTDYGTVTTSRHNAAGLARAMLQDLSTDGPDVIVLELGDGLFGEYGVDAILADEALRASFGAVVLAANDPVGAWGGLETLKREYHLPATLVTGPATDNAAGTDLLRDRFQQLGCNARTDALGLAEAVIGAAGLKSRRQAPQALAEESDD